MPMDDQTFLLLMMALDEPDVDTDCGISTSEAYESNDTEPASTGSACSCPVPEVHDDKYRVALVGSPACPRVDLSDYLEKVPDVILTDGGNGAARWGRLYASEHQVETVEFKPDYQRHGERAELMAGMMMVKKADLVLVLCNGVDSSARYIMEYARRRGVPVQVVEIH